MDVFRDVFEILHVSRDQHVSQLVEIAVFRIFNCNISTINALG